MRNIRSRLTILLFILVIGTSILSLVLSSLMRNNIILVRDQVRYMLFGYAFRDILLLAVSLAIVIVSVFFVSRSATNPIVDITNAMREVASGNFDVQVVLRDRVEEFGELQRGFNLMTRDLRNNAYLRKDFISNVSHELKTPLTIISGYARLLQEGGASEKEQAEYSDLIANESERLIRLTSNMLRLSKMDGGVVSPAYVTFSLDEQIRAAALLLEPKWSEKNLSVKIDMQEIRYTGDAELLSQVWFNLVENAVKFTETGGEIEILMTGGEESVTVSVSDTGAGMDAETANHMFDLFFQGDTSHRREGNGLGLSIVKRIVEIHGGSVTTTSSPGVGSVFTVLLPVLPENLS